MKRIRPYWNESAIPMHRSFSLIPAMCVALSACSTFPELDHTVDSDAQNARYADLVPVETIKSQVPDRQIQPETQDDLEERVKRLNRRANRLSGAVIDDATQERMKAGIEPVTE